MKRAHIGGSLAAAFMLLFAAPLLAQTIDIAKATLNGRPLFEMTLDDVTDALGRPSWVGPLPEMIGARLTYHDRGLSFWFKAEKDDPQQHCRSLSVYLSKRWDETASAFYAQFPGTLVPAVSGNWKSKRVVEEFAPYKPREVTIEDQKRELKDSGLDKVTTSEPSNHIVRASMPGHYAAFVHENTTRFLEIVTVVTEKP